MPSVGQRNDEDNGNVLFCSNDRTVLTVPEKEDTRSENRRTQRSGTVTNSDNCNEEMKQYSSMEISKWMEKQMPPSASVSELPHFRFAHDSINLDTDRRGINPSLAPVMYHEANTCLVDILPAHGQNEPAILEGIISYECLETPKPPYRPFPRPTSVPITSRGYLVLDVDKMRSLTPVEHHRNEFNFFLVDSVSSLNSSQENTSESSRLISREVVDLKPASAENCAGPTSSMTETCNIQKHGAEAPSVPPCEEDMYSKFAAQWPPFSGDGEEIACRICQEDQSCERLISPCQCSGTVGYVHTSCLNTWLQITSRTSCELCGYPYPVTRQPAPLSEFLRNPRANMDLPNFLCDVACLVMLTPLLLSSIYLSSTGTLRYDTLGRVGSLCAVVTLLVALLLVYCSWMALATVYHIRVWRSWQERNSRVSMLSEGLVFSKEKQTTTPRSLMSKPGEKNSTPKPTQAQQVPIDTGGGNSVPADLPGGDTGILLARANQMSGWIRFNNRISSGSNGVA